MISSGNVSFQLFPKMFGDSKIAKTYACARTKTTCILNNAMMPELDSYITNYMSNKDNVYSLVNDGSSDTGLKKMNIACTLLFDVNRSNKVEMKFFDMCSTSGEDASKASTLFDAIDGAMRKRDVDWSNCISVGVDNTNSNIGRHNSLLSRIGKCNENTYIAGCSCHLAHLAAGRGGSAFTAASGFDMEQHQVDLYYYFKGSTRRKGILLEYMEFVGVDWDEMSRFVPTRWLCLERCCEKENKKFQALVSLFTSRVADSSKEDRGTEDSTSMKTRFRRLKKDFQDPLAEVHLQFYTSALAIFTRFNRFLQRSDPQGHKVQPMVKQLIRNIAQRILQPHVVKEPITNAVLEDDSNYLPLHDIHIGLMSKSLLDVMFDEGDISSQDRDKMLLAAQAFFKASLLYVMEKMHVDDRFWKAAVWIDYANRSSASWNDVAFFCTKYASVLNFKEEESDMLYEQFLDFQCLEDIDITEAKLAQHDGEYRIDVIWYILQRMRSPIGNESRFGLLFKVAEIVLIVPHSNACIERVYSLVNKNKRIGSERNRLDIDGSLASIIAVKLDRPESDAKCYEFVPGSEVLCSAKSATNNYNRLHSKAK